MLPPDFDRDQFIAELRKRHSRILPSNVEFSVENGWLPLIAESLEQVEDALNRHSSIGKATVRQIKEKLGDLRIYVRPSRESYEFSKSLAAELAEIRIYSMSKSIEICEVCGDVGEIDNFDGYYQCLCKRHADQRRAWIAGGRQGDIFHD